MHGYIKQIKAKQFNLPLEEEALSRVLSNEGCYVLEKKVFQTKDGDIVVYLEYEYYKEEDEDEDNGYIDSWDDLDFA